MRKIILISMAAIFAIGVMAQQKMRVWKNHSLAYEEDVTQIDSITFYDEYEGALNGVFSVAADKKVRFSKGNLQYNAALGTHLCADGTTKEGTWRFAENQWDYVGDATNGTVYENEIKCNNGLISSSYNGWIDLFGWGTSGWNSGATAYQPYSTSTRNNDYYPGGNSNNDLTDNYANADWGVYNAISNGGNQANAWRTLASEEWYYLFHNRENAEMLLSWGSINGMNGVILLPDNWTIPNGISFISCESAGIVFSLDDSSYYTENIFSLNTYSVTEWAIMEKYGAIFLPADGIRTIYDAIVMLNTRGHYWSSSAVYDQEFAHDVSFDSTRFNIKGKANRFQGRSVRLVCDVK